MNELTDYEKKPFYVVYDNEDNIRFCGTAQQIVAQKHFKDAQQLHVFLSKVRHGKIKGFVVTVSPKKA